MHDYWLKQGSEPLFEDLLWSRPQNRQTAGKLLIIGGNLHGFAAPANAYRESVNAGIGTSRVLLPDALKKTIGKMFEHGEFAPSTPSGSFGQTALAEWLANAAWADATLIAGDLGRNSETAVAIEHFVTKLTNPLVITKDAVDYFYSNPAELMQRPDTTLVLSLSQLQKLIKHLKWPQAVTFSMGLAQLVEVLHDLTTKYPANIITKQGAQLLVSAGGQVSTTSANDDQEDIWRVETAARAAVWWLQNPGKTFEALTTAMVDRD